MFGEFQLIDNYFKKLTSGGKDIILGIGDDAAVIKPPANECLLVSTDTLVERVHFFEDASPHGLGYKSLAVNLSDMAAMGATPRWITASLTLPTVEETWLDSFCKGFADIAKMHQVALVGGDLSAGSLSITIQVMGTAPQEKILYRHGAQVGDKIYVTGCLGDGAGAVLLKKKKHNVPVLLQEALEYPVPQVIWGKVLGGVAHSAIDISDGVLADVTHMMKASQTQGRLFYETLPVSETLKKAVGKCVAYDLALTGGDDYQLCFTIAAEKEPWLQEQAKNLQMTITCIGEVQKGEGIVLLDHNGSTMVLPKQKGFTHWG